MNIITLVNPSRTTHIFAEHIEEVFDSESKLRITFVSGYTLNITTEDMRKQFMDQFEIMRLLSDEIKLAFGAPEIAEAKLEAKEPTKESQPSLSDLAKEKLEGAKTNDEDK